MNRPFLLSVILTLGLLFPSYARETQETITVDRTIPLNCISLTNEFGVRVILPKEIVSRLARKEPQVLDMSEVEIGIYGDRAIELLKSLHSAKDEFGCQKGTLTRGETLYLVARSIKSGMATILSPKSTKPEPKVIYSQTHCGRRHPVGFININTPAGQPVVLMLLACMSRG
ncbi:MAG: hypothetical protein KME17_14965 [Cyanosarcina radialis HA8281-LM2]|jgi:hypothetical protein|nr:hypothetical protein [Cyanosarcina radialis HA8281-LM2]